MSLINDALKKAQKQRTGAAPPLASMPGIGGETPQRIAKRAKPAGFDTLIIRAGVGAGVILVLAIGGWFVLREKPETENLKPEDSNAQAAALQPTLPAQNPAPSSPLAAQNTQVSGFRSQVSAPSTAPAPSSPLPSPGSQTSVPASEPQVSGFRSQVSAPPSSVVPAPTGSSLQVSPFKSPTSARPATAPQTPASNPQVSGVLPGGRPGQTPGSQQGTTVPPASPPAKLEPRAIQFIENIKVGAIMARTATDAKVLMNDRVYRVGSIVEAEMGLTLVEITTGSLTFEDERGGRYTRTF